MVMMRGDDGVDWIGVRDDDDDDGVSDDEVD